MPYALENPLSAGLAAATGVMAGQQAKKQRDAEMKRQAMLDAQAQADTQARLGMAKSQQDATNAFRTTQVRQGDERLANERTRLGIEQQNAARAQAMADAEAQKQKLLDTFKGEQREFFSHEMVLSPDPVKRLGQLQKRYDIERGKGYDTKSTEGQMNKAATEIEQQRRQADLEKQRDTSNAMRQQSINIRVSGGGEKPLTHYQQIELDHWNRTHNPDGTTRGTGAARDTTGMTAGAKAHYDKDLRDYNRAILANPDAEVVEPDPSDPKYAKKSSLTGGTAPRAAATPAPAATKPGTGKTISRADAIRVGGPDGVAKAEALGYTVH